MECFGSYNALCSSISVLEGTRCIGWLLKDFPLLVRDMPFRTRMKKYDFLFEVLYCVVKRAFSYRRIKQELEHDTR